MDKEKLNLIKRLAEGSPLDNMTVPCATVLKLVALAERAADPFDSMPRECSDCGKRVIGGQGLRQHAKAKHAARSQ